MPFKQWEFPIYSFEKEKLGMAGTIAEPAICSTEDCFLISFLFSPITRGRKNTYVVFVSDKELASSINKVQFIARLYRQSSIEPFELELPPIKLDDFEYPYIVIPFTPPETGKLQIEVKLFKSDDASSPERRLVLEQWVKQPYPWTDLLTKLASLRNQQTLPLSLASRISEVLGVVPYIGIWPAVIKHAAVYVETKEQAKLASILGNGGITERIVDDFYPYIDAAYRLHDDDNKRIPKELLIAIIYQQMSQHKLFVSEREHISFGICGLRTGAVAVVAGLEGFDLEKNGCELQKNETKLLGDFKAINKSLSTEPIEFNMDDSPSEIYVDPFGEIYGVWIKDPGEQQLKLDFLTMFPKSNIYFCYELLCQLKKRRYSDVTEAELAKDLNKCKLLAAEFMKLQLELSTWEVKNIDPLSRNNLTEIEEKAKNFADIVIGRLNTPYVALIKHAGLGARTVKATFQDKSKTITHIDDPIHRGWLNFEHPDTDILKAENFGWNPGGDIQFLDLSDADNWEMVFMDVGFWGHYNRDNPRRDFGMIEGKHVWLCRLVYDDECVDDIHGETLIRLQLIFGPDHKSIAEELINELYDEWGYTVELVSYTEAPEPPKPSGDVKVTLPDDKLTIIFPDMHLPEKWPDIPDEKIYPTNGHPDDQDRKDLRALLWSSQAMLDGEHAPRAQAERVQDYLAKVLTNSAGSETFNLNLAGTTVEFNSSQFKAEYDLVERRIRLDNSWFYPSAVHYNPEIKLSWSGHFIDRVQNHVGLVDSQDLQGDPAPAIDLAAMLCAIKKIRSKDSEKVKVLQVGDLYEMWMGNEWLYKDFPDHDGQDLSVTGATDASSLIDITGGPGRFQYRLGKEWLDVKNQQMREWSRNLYEIYKKDDKEYFFIKRHIINEFDYNSLCSEITDKDDLEFLKSHYSKSNGDYLFNGNYKTLYEILNSVLWKYIIPFDQVIPLYIYHEWPTELLTQRKLTGLSIIKENDVDQFILSRAKDDVLSRITAIEDFSLPFPWPDTSACASRKKTLENLKKMYLNQNEKTQDTTYLAQGTDEFLWNKLLLDLFSKVECIMVNGNHDGYRGDPLLKPETEADWEAEPYYSGDGLWVEHGHRWDPYNFDGMAFGPAVTNHVHYTMRPFIQWTDKVKGKFRPDFHTQTLPCSAQWFLIVNGYQSMQLENYQPSLGRGGKSSYIERFSVYIVGHSHTPDLLRVRFKKE